VNVLRLLRRHAHDQDVHVAVGRMAHMPLRCTFGTILDYIGTGSHVAPLPGLLVGVQVSFGNRAGADYGDANEVWRRPSCSVGAGPCKRR